MLSLSTSFNIGKHKDGNKLVDDILSMGFSAMELNVEVTAKMIPQILLNVKQGRIKVGSVHNFCPKIERCNSDRSILNVYRISSLDEEERKNAVKLTKKTVELAAEFDARGVVIHAGEVETEIRGQELFRYVRDFGETKMYYLYKDILVKQRAEMEKPYLESTIRSLEEISKYAEKLNIKLGIENRFYYNEIPSFNEIDIILKHFDGGNVYYWHDVGHGHIFEQLGFVVSHENYLKMYGDRVLGVHLHDVKKLSDHRAPGTGVVDFAMIKRYLPKDTIHVVEAHSVSSKKQVKASLDFLKNLGYE